MAAAASTPAKKQGTSKVALLIGLALAVALAHTSAAPLVVAVLAASIVYQVLNL